MSLGTKSCQGNAIGKLWENKILKKLFQNKIVKFEFSIYQLPMLLTLDNQITGNIHTIEISNDLTVAWDLSL